MNNNSEQEERRKRAKELFDKHCPFKDAIAWSVWKMAFDIAQPSTTMHPLGLQWVKASDRLPDKEGDYFVIYTTGEKQVLYASGNGHEKRWRALVKEWLDEDCAIKTEEKDPTKELVELRYWKESAMKVMADMQEIGKELGVKLGESIHDKILPAIINYKKSLTGIPPAIDGAENLIESAQEACMLIIGTYEGHSWEGEERLERTAEKMFKYAKDGDMQPPSLNQMW